MKMTIIEAAMTYSKEDGYVGKVQFQVDTHKYPYEIALHSKKGKEWSYGLFFLNEPGAEEDIFAVEDYLEENDEAFEQLVEAARKALAE
jgi:predicted RNase H-like HicB family nuclease